MNLVVFSVLTAIGLINAACGYWCGIRMINDTAVAGEPDQLVPTEDCDDIESPLITPVETEL